MARGITLSQLLIDLRAEARISLNPGHNVQAQDQQINLLQRTQSRLWDDFDWPHGRVERQMPIMAGARYYSPPDDMRIERVEKLEFYTDGGWLPLLAGIGSAEYSAHNSDTDERSWPPRRWRVADGGEPGEDDGQIEIWPIADQNGNSVSRDGYLKVTGIRNVRPLAAEGDRSDLDGTLLVLYAAAEILASVGAKDASLKLDAANRLNARLRSGLMKSARFQMFGVGERPLLRRDAITRYRPAGA